MRRPIQRVLLSISLLSLAVNLGCKDDTTGPVPLDPAHLYLQLTLNHHAITMALTPPYDTITLVATPRSAVGGTLADTGTTTYTVNYYYDNCGCNSVTINPHGLLTADSVDANVEVIASHTIGDVTETDSAFVNVTDVNPVPVFTTLTLQPPPGDSAFMSVSDGNSYLFPVALDQYGDTIASVTPTVGYTNSHVFTEADPPTPARGGKHRINLYPVAPGKTLLIANATVYGISLTDTLLYTVGWPTYSGIIVKPVVPIGSQTSLGVFSPKNDTVAVGATVLWFNQLVDQSVDIIFDTPTAVQSADSALIFNQSGYLIGNQIGGNIPAFPAMDSTQGQDTLGVRARSFPIAGSYFYHSTLYGTTGVLYVVPEFQVPSSVQ